MANFMIRFLLCNVLISGIIGILLIVKWVFRNNLSSRMQYNLWLLLLGLLTVPFMPFRLVSFPQIFSWLSSIRNSSASHADVVANNVMDTGLSGTTNWMNDFALSVNKDTLSVTGYILLGIWIVGMLAMMILVIKSSLRLRTIKKSALPLQNSEVRRLYNKCLNEMKITRNIPVYSTAFLKSPIIVGFLKPCIYLPIHLISDYHESDMRYMLLHELQHYRHKDAIANYLMNFAGVLYWFNPFVWFALREMRNDREVACDTSVLKMLEEDDYENYGNTLINFIEKVSISPFNKYYTIYLFRLQPFYPRNHAFCFPRQFYKLLFRTFISKTSPVNLYTIRKQFICNKQKIPSAKSLYPVIICKYIIRIFIFFPRIQPVLFNFSIKD